MGLLKYLSSDYVQAANVLKGGRQRIVAYVESYDDIAFWSQILRQWETPERYFEVMLPSHTSLAKGKKIALSHQLGPNLLACVDADYDWLLQGATPHSQLVCDSAYVFHTHAYAIENLQCYDRGLHEACVKATLNDAHVFPFAAFLAEYSEVIWPLFVWNVWAYRYDSYDRFALTDFARVVTSGKVNIQAPEKYLDALRQRVNKTIGRLQRQFPEGRKTYAPFRQHLLDLGLTPQTTYLYMRGHDLYDGIILPMLEDICLQLRRQRERDINALACHNQQKQNELSAYRRACSPVDEMLRKYNGYTDSPLYRDILADVEKVFVKKNTNPSNSPKGGEK